MAGEGFVGANVTIPHKLAALALADRASDAAREIGAANTLSFTGAGIEAENTDATGLIGALPRSPAGRRALVLGAGGSARAAVWALLREGADVSVWNRTPERAEQLAAELGAAVARPGSGGLLSLDSVDLIVNATTVGLDAANPPLGPQSSESGRISAERPVPSLKALCLRADALSERHTLVDLVYGSAETA